MKLFILALFGLFIVTFCFAHSDEQHERDLRGRPTQPGGTTFKPDKITKPNNYFDNKKARKFKTNVNCSRSLKKGKSYEMKSGKGKSGSGDDDYTTTTTTTHSSKSGKGSKSKGSKTSKTSKSTKSSKGKFKTPSLPSSDYTLHVGNGQCVFHTRTSPPPSEGTLQVTANGYEDVLLAATSGDSIKNEFNIFSVAALASQLNYNIPLNFIAVIRDADSEKMVAHSGTAYGFGSGGQTGTSLYLAYEQTGEQQTATPFKNNGFCALYIDSASFPFNSLDTTDVEAEFADDTTDTCTSGDCDKACAKFCTESGGTKINCSTAYSNLFNSPCCVCTHEDSASANSYSTEVGCGCKTPSCTSLDITDGCDCKAHCESGEEAHYVKSNDVQLCVCTSTKTGGMMVCKDAVPGFEFE